MIKTQLEPALIGEVAREVLETMFFSLPEDAAEPNPRPEDLLTAELKFEGARSGWFSIQAQENCARAIAGNFSGVMDPSELSPETITGVLCELANMVCGATLSRLDPDAIFNLGAPQLIAEAGTGEGLTQWLSMDEGLIGLHLRWERQ
jgi:chemotaxis phosphatase CheX-like protein